MLVWIDFAIRIINLLSDFLGVYIRIARILSQIYLIQLVRVSVQLPTILPDTFTRLLRLCRNSKLSFILKSTDSTALSSNNLPLLIVSASLSHTVYYDYSLVETQVGSNHCSYQSQRAHTPDLPWKGKHF